MMRSHLMTTMIVLSVAGAALARVGEPPEQLRTRFGDASRHPGRVSPPGASSRLVQVDAEMFQKDGVHIVAVYFTDKSGTRIAGEIIYYLSEEIKADPKAEREAAMRLLTANAGADVWQEHGMSPSKKVEYFKRPGVRAEYCTGLGIVVVTLDTFVAFVDKVQNSEANAAKKKASALDGF